nr:energy transducer TonB [Novosphingobium aquimarinum]
MLSAAALVAAEPINPRVWATPTDYPSKALRENQGGAPRFRLTIAADGTPIKCEITDPTPYEELNTISCELLMRRARFKPAMDVAGKPTFAVYQQRLLWWVEGMKPIGRSQRSDAIVTVKRLPGEIPNPAWVRLAFAIDATGTPTNCQPLLPESPSRAGSKAAETEQRVLDVLGSTACKYAQDTLELTAAIDSNGNPVPSVQTYTILFEEEVGSD